MYNLIKFIFDSLSRLLPIDFYLFILFSLSVVIIVRIIRGLRAL